MEARVDTVLQQAMMRVADPGVGIGSELLGRLFNPFEQGAQDLSRSQEAGFDAHLPKPPDIQQLEALLLQVARRGVGQVAS